MKYWTYEQVKYFVENESACKLLSTEYKNNRTKMLFLCKCGKKFSTSFEKFKHRNKRQCNGCGKKVKINNRKLPYIYIKNTINNFGYELLDSEYKNNSGKLSLVDSLGYKYYMPYASIRDKKRGKKFHPSNLYTIENIHLWLSLNKVGYKLLSEKYIGNGTNKDKRKEQILKWLCPEGHKFYAIWNDIYNGQGCNICNKHTKTCEEFEKEISIKYGKEYTLLGKYEKSNLPILVRHNKCGTEWYIRPANLLNGYGCPNNECCHARGNKHYRWKESLTHEQRLLNESRTSSIEYRKWKVNVFKKYNRKCYICGEKHSKDNKLIPHHLNSWDKNISERYDVENGVPLCDKHHKEFHNTYGYGNNTKKQFEEFVKDKLK